MASPCLLTLVQTVDLASLGGQVLDLGAQCIGAGATPIVVVVHLIIAGIIQAQVLKASKKGSKQGSEHASKKAGRRIRG